MIKCAFLIQVSKLQRSGVKTKIPRYQDISTFIMIIACGDKIYLCAAAINSGLRDKIRFRATKFSSKGCRDFEASRYDKWTNIGLLYAMHANLLTLVVISLVPQHPKVLASSHLNFKIKATEWQKNSTRTYAVILRRHQMSRPVNPDVLTQPTMPYISILEIYLFFS
ncbi:hypothetical protein TWF225_006645 [Orbilia oligospora]|uniref:Uncharacterized protein n=1 Tax=Orbilia oligospora TaxID=2813651 RepID=A0A7C8KCE6_ORBOL|nr:hypothetical protein TWF751_007954 [Orbilia oligospora]KAF3181604.1 hypothetical protein TWF225_006645 [Orbilia oligospora]KAF3253295.1 hypothetical protein TWF217_007551 [Orbilia oligospora]KAF3255127.1 hypothetical protein TWF128_005935 [Orbilia oligospora]KAF3298297.1 hypothetical protein TWF132_000126 [Orbilia oligospora]